MSKWIANKLNITPKTVAEQLISSPGIDAFKKHITSSGKSRFRRHPVKYLFVIAFIIAVVVFGMYMIIILTTRNDEDKKKVSEGFSSFIGVVGLVTAIAGIFSVPYLTESSMVRTVNKIAGGLKHYRAAAGNTYIPLT
jgi:cytochrome bd-type quinol oxidase subunit 2